MNIFKDIAKFIAWLSGSVAGLGAIFYACGYLITRAHMHLLGINLEFTNEYYMQEGAKFFVVLADFIGRIFLPLLITLGSIALLCILVLALTCAALYLAVGKERLAGLLQKARLRLTTIYEKGTRRGGIIGFLVLVLLLFLIIEQDLNSFNIPLSLSDLLFAPAPDASSESRPASLQISSWLVAGNVGSLKNYFFNLLLAVLKSTLLLLMALRITAAWRLRGLLVAPFAIIFLLYLTLLPMTYGVLMRPTKFTRIAITLKNGSLPLQDADLFLLDKTDKEFVVWDAARKRVLWVPNEQVKSAELKQSEFVFKGTSK